MAPKAAQKVETQEAVEAKFTRAADKLFEQALDLNVTQMTTANLVSEVLNIRHKLLGMYGVAPDPTWKPGALVYAPPGGAINGGEVSWVQKLYEAMTKTLKCTLEKGVLTFNTVATDDTNKKFTSTATCAAHWKSEYSSSEPCVGKKQAEHSAAKVALEAEYPEFFAQLAAFGGAKPAPQGQKRKAPGDVAPLEGKGLLSHLVCMILSRPATKEDIVYTSSDAGEGGVFSATVKLPNYKGSPTFIGKGPSKKDAETNAAKAACAKLEPVAAPIIEEHKAKKAAKNKENLDKLKKAQEEKKAAAKAKA